MEAVIGVLVIVIVVFAIVTLLRSIRIVPQQRMDVVERLEIGDRVTSVVRG